MIFMRRAFSFPNYVVVHIPYWSTKILKYYMNFTRRAFSFVNFIVGFMNQIVDGS